MTNLFSFNYLCSHACERQGVWGVQRPSLESLVQFRVSLGAKDFNLVFSNLLTFNPRLDPHDKKGVKSVGQNVLLGLR